MASSDTIEPRLQQIETFLKTVVDCGFVSDAAIKIGRSHQRIDTSNAEIHQTALAGATGSSHSKPDASSRLEIVDSGSQEFRGHSSGCIFLSRMQQKYGDLLAPETVTSTTVTTQADPPQVFDTPQSSVKQSLIIPPPLPPKTVAGDLVECALENVCPLSRIVHRPTFDIMLNRIYDLGVVKQGSEETKFLSLLYVLMALGCFASNIQIESIGQTRTTAAG